jgi:hypothetical protein
MICRKARPGQERERYVCSGRIEHGREFCEKPSVRRELVDEPFLEHLLNGYIDLDATARRIEQRTASAVTLALDAVADAEADVAGVERALAATERAYDAEVIDGRQYAKREARLTGELDGARNALLRASEHAREAEAAQTLGDGEQLLLAQLAAVKRAVADGAAGAPDLDALRNLIGQMFESVALVRGFDFARTPATDRRGFVPFESDVGEPPSVDGDEGLYMVPVLRWSAVDRGTFSPIGQEMPVGCSPQYPDPKTFFSRYCWW